MLRVERIGQITYQLSEEEYNKIKAIVSHLDSYINHNQDYYKGEAIGGLSTLIEMFEIYS